MTVKRHSYRNGLSYPDTLGTTLLLISADSDADVLPT